METYSFIITEDELVEARLNTTEPFDRLFITKLPSEDVEVGYEVRDEVLTIKYEQLDDERLLLAELTADEIRAHDMPHIYGVILKLHGIRKLKLGKDVIFYTSVTVNSPCGVWHAVRDTDGTVFEHAVKGTVFIRTEDWRYTALSSATIVELYRRYVLLGQGQFIPSMYLIRVRDYEYLPLNTMFHLPEVAHSFYPSISSDGWENLRQVFIKACEDKL